ncbi:hypothetical protein MBLNU230_g6959t1 [Neophaeotheca triangularis]
MENSIVRRIDLGGYACVETKPPQKPADWYKPMIHFEIDSLWLLASNLLTLATYLRYTWAGIYLAYWTDSICMLVLTLAEAALSFDRFGECMDQVIGKVFGFQATRRPRYLLSDDEAPHVDVVITVCGESVDIIRDTIGAAAYQEYPSESLHVYVLNDGKEEKAGALMAEIFKINEELQRVGRNTIQYLSRPKVPDHGYKSGNLQFGFLETAARTNSIYFAALDADMAPDPNWLRLVVPHLLEDSKIGMVCPGQRGYNIPEYDNFAQDTELFYDVDEPMQERVGAANCPGSGYVAVRAALDSIGGFPKLNVGEDIFCAYKLKGKNWGIAFIPDKIQSGLQAESFHHYIKQRKRWAAGTIANNVNLGFFLPGASKDTEHMSRLARFGAIRFCIREYTVLSMFGGMIFLAAALAWFPASLSSALGADTELSNWFRKSYLTWYAVEKVNTYLLVGRVGLFNGSNARRARVWGVPYFAQSIFMTTIYGDAYTEFEPTGIITSEANERSSKGRASRCVRVLDTKIVLHLLAGLAMVGALGWRFWVAGRERSLVSLLAVGALVKLFQISHQISYPFFYMWSPPDVPERKELLVARKGSRTFIPKLQERPVVDNGLSWKGGMEILIIGLCCSDLLLGFAGL